MKLFDVERRLLQAINEGQEVAEGDDYETCVRLIRQDLVTGDDISSLKGQKYGYLKITAIGSEVLSV